MSESKQYWQERIIADILNSADSSYYRTYTMPRGSGASTLFLRLAREMNVTFANTEMKIVLVVPSQNHKRYVSSYLKDNPMSLAAFSGQRTVSPVKVVASITDIQGYSNYIDWLLVDGVPDDSDIMKQFDGLIVHNKLAIYTG